MKKSLLIFAAILMMAGFTNKVMAQQVGVTGGTLAAVKIVSAIGLEQGTTTLNFGTMAIPSGAVQVTVSADGTTRSADIPANVALYGTTFSSAEYKVTGANGSSYNVILPSTPLTLSSGVTVTNFTSTKTSGTITSGQDLFKVGARLNLASGTLAATYTGTFDVYVNNY